jgi:phosphoglycerate dehydrogenase-like enzyme
MHRLVCLSRHLAVAGAFGLASHTKCDASPPERPPFNVHFDASAVAAWPKFVDLARSRLERDKPHVRVTVGPSLARCDLLVAGSKNFGAAVLDKAQPRALLLPHAGVPGVFRSLLLQDEYSDIALYNLHHNAHSTAELAIALLLGASRKLVVADRELRAGKWLGRTAPTAPALGATLQSDRGTVLVLGYGHVGKRVASVCQALGMRVLVTCRDPTAARASAPVPAGIELHGADSLPALLPQCSAVVVALPLTDDTRGVLGQGQLALMLRSPQGTPKKCVLVNVGRAEVVQEQALWEALQLDGGTRLAYAADVWWEEPANVLDLAATEGMMASGRHPFHALDNVTMTPHFAGGKGLDGMEEARVAAFMSVVDGMDTDTAVEAAGQQAGSKPLKAVDVQLGY